MLNLAVLFKNTFILHAEISYIVTGFHTIIVSHDHCNTAFFWNSNILCLCITHKDMYMLLNYIK